MNKERLPVYDLNNSYFLYGDIEMTLDQISELFEIDFQKGKNVYKSKIVVSKEHSWISNECTSEFNKMIPKIKSITKDMYSLIEGIYKYKDGKFDKPEKEKKNPYLKELRILNNKFKHHDNREANILLTQISNITDNGTGIDCYIRFEYLKTKENITILFCNLVNVFIQILEKENIIDIEITSDNAKS